MAVEDPPATETVRLGRFAACKRTVRVGVMQGLKV
jgi:hypothetical protein